MSKIEQEPAAWRAKSPDRIPQFFDCERDARLYCGTSEWIIEPLYLHPQPAPEVALVEAFDAGQRAAQAEAAVLVDALDEMIDVAQRVDSWESFPSAPIERAQNALAAYRKQGGES